MESFVIYTLILGKLIQYFCQKQLTTHRSNAHRSKLLPNVFGILAVLAGVFCGGIADGDECHGLVAFGELEQALELVDVEVAHPTSGKALLGGGKAEVLNGVAYNPTTGHFYVTGKDWNKLFEIEIIK